MKLMFGTALFILGLGGGAALTKGVDLASVKPTEVWTAKVPLISAGGVAIPAGTELVVVKYMPEGFVASNLRANVESEALQLFDRRTDPATSLSVPQYFYEAGDE